MSPDPRSLPRAAKRVTRQTAARIGGVDEVQARLDQTAEQLERAVQERATALKERDTARRERDAARKESTSVRARADEEQAALAAQVRDLEDRREAALDRARGLGYAHRGLRAAALGHRRPSELGAAPGRAPDPDEREAQEDELRWVRARAQVVDALARGESLESAVAALVRQAQGPARTTLARQVAQALYDRDETRPAGALATGLIAHRMGLGRFAWQQLSSLPDEVWLEHAASEYVQLAGSHDPPRARAALEHALAHEGPLTTSTWQALARRAMGLQLTDLVGPIVERFDAAATTDLADADADRALELERAWVGRWAPRVVAGPVPPSPALAGTVAIGLLGHDQPDRRATSPRVGDRLETLALLAHVVRHAGVEPDAGDLGRFAAELAARVPEERRLASPPTPVTLHQVDRDAASWSAVPEGTWLLVAGSWAERFAGVGFDLPYPAHLRPLYLSLHVARRAVLTDEVVAHLRAHAPIGCRDHATVDLLLGHDVPAFLAGALTTTIDLVAEPGCPQPGEDAPTAWLGLPAPSSGLPVRPSLHPESLADDLRAALDVVDGTPEWGRVVTSDLDVHLATRSLGRPGELRPRQTDLRLLGPGPLTDDEVDATGQGLTGLLEPVIAAIVRGDDDATVRAAWTDVTGARVAAARARHEAEVDLPSLVDVAEAVATIAAGRVDVPRTEPAPPGDEMEVVLALDANLKEQFLVVVDGLVTHASRPIHLNVLSRDHGPADHERVAALFPTVSLTWWPCDEVDYGEVHAMIPHITISTMDRLVLPELLADVDRVVYHDIDALPVADVAELHDTDLRGAPIGARDLEASVMQSGWTHVFGPAADPGLEPGMGAELIRRETHHHGRDFTAFNAGIMVLDLARMRADRFCERYLPYVHAFGMNDQQILNAYAGAHRLSLAEGWNARPSQEEVTDPRIIHWAGGQKPWAEGYVSYRGAWRHHEERVRRRADALSAGHATAPVDTDPPTRESL